MEEREEYWRKFDGYHDEVKDILYRHFIRLFIEIRPINGINILSGRRGHCTREEFPNRLHHLLLTTTDNHILDRIKKEIDDGEADEYYYIYRHLSIPAKQVVMNRLLSLYGSTEPELLTPIGMRRLPINIDEFESIIQFLLSLPRLGLSWSPNKKESILEQVKLAIDYAKINRSIYTTIHARELGMTTDKYRQLFRGGRRSSRSRRRRRNISKRK